MATTHEDMRGYSPYELAAWWADRECWPAGGETCDELAVMCALGAWLRRWVPLAIHRALAAGATVEQVCAATGLTASGVRVEWTQWAAGQRHLYDLTPPGRAPAGMSPGEYERVRAVLAGEVP